MRQPYPSLYQVNTRVTLASLSRTLGRDATLDDFPDAELDRLAGLGFDWIWFLGVWQTGPWGRRISRSNAGWRHEFRELLVDFDETDVCGSCFAVQRYDVHSDFGGNAALARLRQRIQTRGMRLLLDFVPNHTAPDHPWVEEHPEYYVPGTVEELANEPRNYTRIETSRGPLVLAYGRDPYFDGWPDTLQLNYADPAMRQALLSELKKISGMCDGVRCDMAMLVLPDVFERTWGLRPEPFWPTAIMEVKAQHPGFLFMAEVYWDLEWTLQQQGFDYTYDKRLYDRLIEGHAQPVRDHFRADLDYQQRSARFLENHDEPRAASAFSPNQHRAAAALTFLCPGLRFIHQGQMEGYTRRIPVHLSRGPAEPCDIELRAFYERLLRAAGRVEARQGAWQLLDCAPAWEGNWTSSCFVCFLWQMPGGNPLLVAVNFAPNQSQCLVRLPLSETTGKTARLTDLLGPEVYYRDMEGLTSQGLYLDLPPWGYNAFELSSKADS
ncbi:MAG: alpha-amylase [Bryobacterales bacterium]|nr:alpha-amylase [Bryobacterales bacterium]